MFWISHPSNNAALALPFSLCIGFMANGGKGGGDDAPVVTSHCSRQEWMVTNSLVNLYPEKIMPLDGKQKLWIEQCGELS